jgi:hypothetical protein
MSYSLYKEVQKQSRNLFIHGVIMASINEYITIEEAAKITKKSISTIRRFVQVHKDTKDDIIRVELNPKNRPLYKINKSFIITYYDVTKRNIKKRSNFQDLEKQSEFKNIKNLVLGYKKAYIFSNILFIGSLSFFVIVFAILIFYIRSATMENYDSKIEYLKSEIKLLKNMVGEYRENASVTFQEKEELNRKVNITEDSAMKDLMLRLRRVERLLAANKRNNV